MIDMIIGCRDFPMNQRTYLMGILNVTPDSFSDGGQHNQMNQAVAHALHMEQEGADIIDVGGESTRPGYTMISEEEEIRRVVPVIEAIRKKTDIPISIDTYKSQVAKAALDAGADLVNDIWGLKYDPAMAGVVKSRNAAVCIMHNRKSVDYHNFLKDVKSDLKKSVDIAINAGINRNKIILDPGIGFAKTYDMNLCLLKNLELMHEQGYPILLGASRKSVVGLAIKENVENRLEGTIALTVMAVMKGCQFIRVHDVKENRRAITMTEAVLKSQNLI